MPIPDAGAVAAPGLAHVASVRGVPLASFVKDGPKRAASALGEQLLDTGLREDWLARARLVAILGPASRSLPSLRSGLRAWISFARQVLRCQPGREFPPTRDGLVAWSLLFRCPGTFANYLAYLRIGCLLARLPVDSLACPEVKRAKAGIAKRMLSCPRPHFFIRLNLLEKLVSGEHCEWFADQCALWVLAYAFLLRVPSEALPCLYGGRTFYPGAQSSICFSEDGKVGLRLARRKNRPRGSTLWRGCWCQKSATTCPVHVLARACMDLVPGQALFPGWQPANVLVKLRVALGRLNVPRAKEYRTHDFRRGHAQDLAAAGADLASILAAGEWRSPAFLAYLSREELEGDAVLQAHLAESDDEEAA